MKLVEINANYEAYSSSHVDFSTFKFSYDDCDRLTEIQESCSNDKNFRDKSSWFITYIPFMLKCNYFSSATSESGCITYFPTLSNSIISSMRFSDEGIFEGNSYVDEGNIEMTYNNGFLINCSSSSDETVGQDKYHCDGKENLMWNDGILEKYTSNTINVEPNSDEYVYVQSSSYSYGDGKTKNMLGQIPQGLLMDSGQIEFLYMLGFMGKGPDFLPTSLSYTNEDGDKFDVVCSYTFNDNGTISRSIMSCSEFKLTTDYKYEPTVVQTGINKVTEADVMNTEVFDAMGVKCNHPCRGLNILRKSDGNYIKMIER